VAHDLTKLLGPEGVATTASLVGRVERHTIDSWVARRRLLRPYPGVIVLPERAHEWDTRVSAALYATGGTLSHTTALAVWRLLPREGDVHVSIPAGRRAVRGRGLSVHRVQRLVSDRLGPYPVTPLSRCLVDTWGLACRRSGSPRAIERARAAVIETLRDRRVRVAELRAESALHPALPGRAELERLIDLVAQGCQSELEIWGVREVLSGPGLPRFVQQHPVALPFGQVHLDAAVPELKVAVELDGAAFHGSPEARERDLRRDAALAALGWVVLRFSYRRLMREPEACRREIAQACAARAALLAR
jgi:very-short-patch-repair endonuclease